MREKFVHTTFRASTIELIETADRIISEYQRRGFKLTLRQLYYQFVARDLLPNQQQQYKRLGKIVNDARMAGLLDWSAIEDRTRNVRRPSVWESPEDIVEAVADQYKEDLWVGQPYRPEVWIEKDALVGVIEGVCKELRLPYFACRGYASQSEVYDAGKRFSRMRMGRGQRPIVLHLGDHDPSGLDMTRDLEERLSLFAERDVAVRRLALNMNQIEEYNPPPNPAKDTDARFEGYREAHGDESWELDALDPDVIANLIRDNVKALIDEERWAAAVETEEANKRDLQAVADRWTDVSDFINN